MSRNRTDYQVRVIMKQNRDGSPDRQKARHRSLMLCIRQLQARGYGQRWDVHRLGKKEVHRLVHDWRSAGLSHRTIANRLVDLRWLAEKVGRLDQVPSNRSLGIPLRRNISGPAGNRAHELDHGSLGKLDQRAQLVTELRREFGLRAREAIRFQHEHATSEAGKIRLAGPWCPRGRQREVAVTTDRQRDLLDRVGRFQRSQPLNRYGHRSMIPPDMKFATYYREFNRARHAEGLPGDGLRHAWAQERFEQLAGFPPPIVGGPGFRDLAGDERNRWLEAVRILCLELGITEGREDSVSIYIGSTR